MTAYYQTGQNGSANVRLMGTHIASTRKMMIPMKQCTCLRSAPIMNPLWPTVSRSAHIRTGSICRSVLLGNFMIGR